MSEINPAVPFAKPAARPLLLFMSFILSIGLVFLVLRGGWSLGFFLAILLTEAVLFIWLHLPSPGLDNSGKAAGRKVDWPVQVGLALIIIDLGLCQMLYDDMVIRVLNLLVLFALVPLQYLLASGYCRHNWDTPYFWLEMAVSFIVRPFSGLAAFGRSVQNLFRRKTDADGSRGAGMAGRVLLGLLMAVPVVLVAGALLSSADQVFGQLIDRLVGSLSVNEIIIQLVIALFLLPFIFSFLFSGREGREITEFRPTSAAVYASQIKIFRIDRVVLISFLSCVNLLYILFAVIQATYLTGAFNFVLPADMTYAEYARSGFFELAGMTFINLLLVLLAVKGSGRDKLTGKILRAESLLLIAGSLVQWASAMFRMNMYVQVFGLSLMRFWVTAFMILQFAIFLMLLLKEFLNRFPLFKAVTAAILLALLAVNHVNSDAVIARYNVDRYLASGQIDTAFFNELSSSAIPVMIELTSVSDPAVAGEIADQLINRLDILDIAYNNRWQQYNIAQSTAKKLVENQLDRLENIRSAAGISARQP